MQSLWSRILASQANNPGSFTKKTLNIVGAFDKSDAEIFTTFCSFVWIIDDRADPIVGRFDDKIINDAGISFDNLMHLDDVGLITFDGIQDFAFSKFPKG